MAIDNNIFRNQLVSDCFKYEIVERVFNDWKSSRKNPEAVNRENAEEMLWGFFEEFEFAIDEFLDEEF